VAEVQRRIDELAASCQQRLDSSGVRFDEVREVIALDMLYAGQTHTLPVVLGSATLTAAAIRTAFEASYTAAFGRVLEGIAIRVMNLRYARIGVRPKFDLKVLAPEGQGSTAPLGTQRVFHDGRWHEAQRYARLELPVAARIEGPAILEQADTTVWLEPGFHAEVDAHGNLLVMLS